MGRLVGPGAPDLAVGDEPAEDLPPALRGPSVVDQDPGSRQGGAGRVAGRKLLRGAGAGERGGAEGRQGGGHPGLHTRLLEGTARGRKVRESKVPCSPLLSLARLRPSKGSSPSVALRRTARSSRLSATGRHGRPGAG